MDNFNGIYYLMAKCERMTLESDQPVLPFAKSTLVRPFVVNGEAGQLRILGIWNRTVAVAMSLQIC